MRKRIVSQTPIHTRSQSAESWLDLEEITTIEVTSEEPNFPIESALGTGKGPGWRALEKGEQQIRILFDRPTSLKRIRLRFVEPEVARTQEFTIRWSSPEGGPQKEVVRQQWNFSPSGSTSEVEEYQVSLDGVSVLELAIKPDLGRETAPATLAELRIA